jgi:hypothetical protein
VNAPTKSGQKTNGKKRTPKGASAAAVPATAPLGQKKGRGSSSSTSSPARKESANGSSAGTLANGKKRARASTSKKKTAGQAGTKEQATTAITAASGVPKAQQEPPSLPPSCILPPTFGADTPFSCFDAFVQKNPLGLGLKLKNVDEKAVVRGFAPWRLQAAGIGHGTAGSGGGGASSATNGSGASTRRGNGSSSSSSSGSSSATPSSVFLGTTEVRVNDVIVSVNNLDARAELFNTVTKTCTKKNC